MIMRTSPRLALVALCLGCSPAAPSTPALAAARDVVVQFTTAIRNGDQDAARALLITAERGDTRRQFAREGLSDGYEVGDPVNKDGVVHVTVTPKSSGTPGGKPVTFALLPEPEGWRVSLSASMHATLGREFASLHKTLEDTGRQMAERMAQSQGQAPAQTTPPTPSGR